MMFLQRKNVKCGGARIRAAPPTTGRGRFWGNMSQQKREVGGMGGC
uniref:Uncharacterized protein n=1 Tax=Picea glauca TaxID=3330 RepID=A0A101LUC2_PICGL|nr:hypothetical protein ABT39_MTgene2609 [Picea glauca]